MEKHYQRQPQDLGPDSGKKSTKADRKKRKEIMVTDNENGSGKTARYCYNVNYSAESSSVALCHSYPVTLTPESRKNQSARFAVIELLRHSAFRVKAAKMLLVQKNCLCAALEVRCTPVFNLG